MWQSVSNSNSLGPNALRDHSGALSAPGPSDPRHLDALAELSLPGMVKLVQHPHHERSPQAEQYILNMFRQEMQKVELTPNLVLLNVYDLRQELQRVNEFSNFSMDIVAMGGAFHVAVEVFGSEWYYGTNGVECELPRTCEGHVYRCSVFLGRTSLSQHQFAEHMLQLCRTWRGRDYDVLARNCCCFADVLCDVLQVSPIPDWADRFPRLLDRGRTVGQKVLDVIARWSGDDSPTDITAWTAPWWSGGVPTVSHDRRTEDPFAPGTPVEYHSRTINRWIPASIVAFHPDSGLVDLDCKPQVPLNLIRRPEGPPKVRRPRGGPMMPVKSLPPNQPW